MSRALRRHHRARVIANREREALAYFSAWPSVYRPNRDAVWPRGALADNQYWLGCNTPRCCVCHPDKLVHRTADRMSAERMWRREWGG